MLGLPLISALLACRPDPVPVVPTPDPPTPDITLDDAFAGLPTQRGRVVQIDEATCQTIVANGTACPGGVNRSSPYGMWSFEEDPPPGDGNFIFQLAPDEVLLYVGQTPPLSRYFSYTLYQYSRPLDDAEFFGRGSVAPSLNHRLIALGGADTPFSRPVVILVALNQDAADQAITRLQPFLEAHGLVGSVNVMAIPWRNPEDTEALREAMGPDAVVDFTPGHGPRADRYMVAFRVADPVDPEHVFFHPTDAPGQVMRVRFEDVAYTPYAYPDLPPDDTSSHTEGSDLREARDAVLSAVMADHNPERLETAVIETTNGARKVGFECNNGLTTCFLNSDDARYLRQMQQVQLFGADASLTFVGVLHEHAVDVHPQAAEVSYSNLSIVDRDALSYTLASRMDRELRGSAAAWFPQGVPGVSAELLDTLFVVQVARSCTPDVPVCIELPFDDVPAETHIGWTERVYLNEATHTAPPSTAVWPVISVGMGRGLVESSEGIRLE